MSSRTRSLVSLFDFENRRGLFPDVDSRTKFCLFTTGNGSVPMSDRADFVFFAHAVEELHDPERRFTLSPDDIALLNPNTRTCPIFRSRKDAELTKAIYRRVPVLHREASDGQPEENPWGIRFRQGLFNMTSDSGLFHSRSDLEASGWKLKGNVFQKNGEEYLPLYEAKMIHQFDHRWASYSEADTEDVADDVPLSAKQSPVYAALPRHWVEAREVYLRCAELPKGLLSALRTRDTSLIVLGVVHLLFAHRLRQISGGSASAVLTTLFAAWIEFVERHPLARRLAPTQMGLCGNNPGTLPANWMELSTVAAREPPTVDLLMRVAPGPDYLPARPLDDVQVGSRNTTLWYAVDETAVSGLVEFAARYRHLFESMPDLRDVDDALTCAEQWLQRTTPRWLMGVRDIARCTDERTVVGGVFPISAVGHNLPVWTASAKSTEVLPALLSSLACDFSARLKVGGTHLSFFIAKQIPILAPEVVDQPAPWGHPGESVRDWLMPRVLELTYGTWDLEPFASDCSWDGPPFRWEEERRSLLRCELDAAFFHLYLTADEYGEWQPPCEVRETVSTRLPNNSPSSPTTSRHLEMRSATSWTRFRSFAARTRLGTGIIAPNESSSKSTTRCRAPPLPASRTAPASIRRPPIGAAAIRLASPSLILHRWADGEWARPEGDETGAETAVLAAVLKAIGSPVPARVVRLTALLAMEPRLLTPSLSVDDARHWERLVGPEATAHDSTAAPSASHAWGTALRWLRGTGRLIENLSDGTWAPGSGLDAIPTEGWPAGRVGMVMQTLRRRDPDEIVRTLPENIRGWINVEAA